MTLRSRPYIHRRVAILLVLAGLATTLPFATSAQPEVPVTQPASGSGFVGGSGTPPEQANAEVEPTAKPTDVPAATPPVDAPESAPADSADPATPSPTPTADDPDEPTDAPPVPPTDSPSQSPDGTGEPEPTTAPPSPEPTATPSPTPTDPPADAPQMPFIVTFRIGASSLMQSQAVEAVGGLVMSTIPELRMASVVLPDLSAAVTLQSDPLVSRVEVDRTRAAEASPSDPLVGDQWALARIGWNDVFGWAQPTASTIVAILDTGVAASHPDLVGRLLPGVSFVDGVGADTDPNGHGTWMAGIVAAATDNEQGVAGVAWGAVKVLPLTVLDANGLGQDSAVIAGLVRAVDEGADVALMAFSSASYSSSLQAAVDYAWAHDVVVVAATGNDGSTTAHYPAGDRGVVGVASSDEGDQLAAGSNSGPAAFMAAPGVGVLTTGANGDYLQLSGTSVAAAMVAGSAALMRAVDPSASNGAIVGRLARDAAPMPDGVVGNGRLDLARALADTSTSPVQPAGVGPTGSGGPFVGPYAASATATWTGGGGDNNWTTGANWGGIAPVAGDDLVFPAGALRLSNTNNFAAGTAFNSITVSGTGYTLAGNSIALGGGGIVASGAGATNTISMPFTLAAITSVVNTSATLTVSGTVATAGFTITYDGTGATNKSAGAISGTGSVTKDGTGVLTYGVANTYTGATTINVGTLRLSIANGVGSSSAVTVASGATFDLGGFSDTIGSLSGDGSVTSTVAGSVVLTTGNTSSTSFSGVISDGSGTVGVTKAGSGTFTLSGANTYSGVTRMNTGVLAIASDGVLGTAPGAPTPGHLTFGGGTLQATASFTLDANRGIDLVGNGTILVDPTMTLTYGGVIAGAGNLTKSGTGTLVMSGTSTYTGNTTVSAGVLGVQSNAALGATTGGSLVSSGAALEIDGSGLSIAEPITSLNGTGISAGGALRNLANSNTWSGLVTLAGTTRINSDAGTLTLSGGINATTRALTFGGAGDGSIAGISGTTASLTKDGAGTLTLTAANTHTGVTTINAGTLKLAVTDAVGPSSALTVAVAGTFDLAGFSNTVGSLAGAGSVTSSAGGAVTLATTLNTSTTYSGVMSDGSGTVSLTKNGTGTLTLSGSNTYGGVTTINAGTVSVAADTALGTAPGSPTPGQLVFNGGTLLVSATFTLDANRGIALASNGTVSVNSGRTLTYSGTMAGANGLTKIGTGALVLSGTNTYDGATTINAGTVSVVSDASLGTAPGAPTPGHLTFGGGTLLASATMTLDANRGIDLVGNGTILVDPTMTLTYGGVIAGAGNLTKSGTGTLVMSGTSTYTGNTTVSAGVLGVQSNAALGATTGGSLVSSGAALEIDGSGLSIAEPITSLNGTGISAGGALRNLANSNTWSGLVTLAGTTRINSDAGTLTLSGGINATTRALTFGGAGDGSIAGISGTTASLTKDGAGTLTLTAANTHTGVTTINAGTLKLAVTDAVGPSSALTVAVAGTFDLAGFSNTVGSLAGAGSVTSSAGGAVTLATTLNTSTTYSGVMSDGSGTVSLTKNGTGTLTLSGSNTYGGVTTINAGTVSVAADTALGTAPGSPTPGQLVFNGGTLLVSATFTLDANRGIALASNGTVSVNSGRTLTYSGTMAGANGLTKIGTGALVLSGTNTYDGATTINAGTVSVVSDASLGTAPGAPTPGHLTFGGGTLLASATMTLDANRGIDLVGNGTLSANAAVTLSYGGVIVGAANLAKTGTGIVVLSGVNTYSGITTLTAGTLSIAADSALGTAPGAPVANQLTFGGGTLQATASFTLDINRGITLTGAGTLNVDPSMTLSYDGVITGASALTKSGTGTLLLSGANTHSGATTVTSGVLRMQSATALGTTAGGTSVSSGASLDIDGAGLVINENMTSIIGTGASATGALRNLANDNTWAGLITLGPGGATLVSDAGTLTLSGGVAGTNRSLTVDGAGDTTITGAIATANGSLIKDGSGTLTVAAVNSYVGATMVNAGTLKLAITNAIDPGSALVVAGGALFDLAGFSETVGSLAGAGNVTSSAVGPVTLATAENASTTFSGAISDGLGSVSLAKAGTGTLTLSGTNTYSGSTTISGGTISIAADDGLGTPPGVPSPGHLTFGGGTLLASATLTLDANRGIALSGNGTLSANAAVTLSYGGVIDGAGNLAKTGTGIVVLSGTNTYTGTTTLTAGTLSVAADAALGTAPGAPVANQLTFGGGTLQATASFTLDANRGITLTGAGTFNVDPATTLTYGGVIAGAGDLTKTGAGTLELAGSNTYTGATNVNGGVLRVQNSSALGGSSAGTTVTPGETVEIDGSGLLIAEPFISIRGSGVGGMGALRNLANTNTWSGAIALGGGGATISSDGGSLVLSAGVTGDDQALTIDGSGDVQILGAIATASGTLTKNGAGVLTLSAGNTYTGRTNLNGGVVAVTADDALGTPPVTLVTNQLNFAGGTLATNTSMTVDSNRGMTFNVGGGGIFVGAGATVTYAGTTAGNNAADSLIKAGAGVLDFSSAAVTLGGLLIADGIFVAPAASVMDVNGDFINNADPSAFVAGSGTVLLSKNSTQLIGGTEPTTFFGLQINNGSGITMSNDATVDGTLTLTDGTITTGVQNLYVSSTGSVSRTSGHVVGNLRKYAPVGAPSLTFEVGDASAYAPVTLTFAAVSVAGDLTVSSTFGDHLALGSSAIDPAQSVNRFWTLTGPSIAFTDFAATFEFAPADIDVGADTFDFGVAGYSGSSWQTMVTGTQAATSTQALNVTTFGDFAVGELAAGTLDHFVVTAVPSTTAGTPFDVTVTAVDALGNRIGSYLGTINFSSTDPHAAFTSPSYAFTFADHGTVTLTGGVTLMVAGTHTVAVADGAITGTSASITVNAGPFTQLQVLVPGEAADPGSVTGKTGTPLPQTANTPFNVTVNAVDAYWNVVSSTDTVDITSSDPFAALPPSAALVAGSGTFTVNPQSGGATTVTATDLTDGTKTPNTSSSISVTNNAPTAVADTYEMFQDNTLTVAAAGVLANDTDPELQVLSVAAPMPVSGPLHGSLTLNADGSFTYTPNPGYSGTDTFTYVASDPGMPSVAGTVTIYVRDHSLISASGWGTSFDGGRYLDFTFPSYVPATANVVDATFHFAYRSLDAAGTSCYYIEVYDGGTLIGSHGSSGAPAGCNNGASYAADSINLSEVNTVARANNLKIRIFMRDSAGARSQINLGKVSVDYSVP